MSEFRSLPSLLASRRACLTGLMSGMATGMALSLPVSMAHSAEAIDNQNLDVWQRSRAQWLVNPRVAYFDNASFVPMNRAVLAAQYRSLEAFNSDPSGFYADRLSAEPVRQWLGTLAEWLHVGVDELCLTRTDGLAFARLLDAIRLQPGDEILVARQMSPVWLSWVRQFAAARGCALVTVHLPTPIAQSQQVLDAFAQAISPRTRVMCFSHIQVWDGAVLPVAALSALARERGMVTLVDGTLASGALNLSLPSLGCDAYFASLSHAVHGPAPLAALYVSSALQASLSTDAMPAALPAGVSTTGWPLLQQRWPMELVQVAPHLPALSVALQWHQSLGSMAVENRLRRLQTYARLQIQSLDGAQLLTPADYALQAHLLSLHCAPRSARQIATWLQRNDNVVVRAMNTDLGADAVVQMTFDVCNSLDDIDRLVLGLKRALKL